MASLMKSWITPTAEDELSMAYESLRSEYTSGQHLERYPYICGKGGLSVHLKKGRCVQVIDVFDLSQELKDFAVVLSDGTTKIRASFTSIYTAEFASLQKFAENALGAVLGISEYYLTYNPNSPSSERLVLRVTDFTLQGCLGERTFGRPVDIEKQKSLWGVLSKVDDLLHNKTQEPEEELDLQSQAGDLENPESSPMLTSQAAFATQVQSRVVANHKAPILTNGYDLLALLNKPKGENVATALERKTITNVTTARSTVNPQSVLQPMPENRKAAISSRLDSMANSQSSIPSSDSNDSKVPPRESNLSVSPILDDDSEKENSQESLNKEPISISAPSIKPTRPAANVKEQGASEMVIAHIPEGNPFEGMKRIPRSYIRIPESQKALLDSKESWYQPGAGRSSYANIPLDVLKDLSAHVERYQSGQKLQSIKKIKIENAGNDNDEDSGVEEEGEASEDGGRQMGDVEEMSQPLKQGDTYDDSESEEESLRSWDESHYGDVKAETTEAAHGLSPSGRLNFEAVEARPTSLAADLPPEHTFSPLLLAIPTMPPISVVKPKIDYNFPSSSPGDDEELEIAVPYAIDDEVEVDNDKGAEEPETSQELPSTAVQAKQVIQVEHTPDHNAHEDQKLGNGKQSDLKLHQRYFEDTKGANEDISSDPIIPATFHDPSSQDRLPASKKGVRTSSDNRMRSAISSAEDPLYALQEKDTTSEDQGVINEEGEMAEEQLFAEVRGSQREKSRFINSSPIRLPSPANKSSKSATPASLERKEMLHNVSLSPRSPQQPNSSSFYTALTEIEIEYDNIPANESSPAKQESLTRSPQPEIRKFKNRPSRQVRALAASQGEWIVRNTANLAKAARRSFHERYSSPLEEPPIVQIAQSQPQSAIKQASPDGASAGETLPQSSDEYVRSSVPETTEQGTSIGRTTEIFSAVAGIPREQLLPALLEASQPFEVAEFIGISESRKLSLLESLDLADDLNMVEPLEGAERPLLSETTKTTTSSGSRSLSLVGTLQLADDLDMATMLDSNGEPQNVQRGFALPTMKLEVEEQVETVSIPSDSDGEELADENDEEVDEDEFQLGYIKEADQERYPSPGPNEERTSEQVLASDEELFQEEEKEAVEEQPAGAMQTSRQSYDSPEPTAFERYKSIYPSYSGSENKFIWAIVYIDWLVENKGEDFLRASLWDDFIRFLAAEFLEYMREARKTQIPKEKIKTGFAYFNKLDKPPIFQNRVITPDNLPDCLLTFDAVQVHNVRNQFSGPVSTFTEPSQPEFSHGSPSVASKGSQNNQIKGKSIANTLIEIGGLPELIVLPEPESFKALERAQLKRPFFETPSQLQAVKRPRTFPPPNVEDLDVEVPRTSKTRRSLLWGQKSSPQPSDTPGPISRNKPLALAPTFSPRIRATTTKPKQSRPTTSSSSFNGSSASPILGKPEPASRSFSAIDVRTSSISSSPLNKFKTPTAPISRSALQRSNSSKPHMDENSKVEGWLNENPSPVHPSTLLRKESIKRKRESGLDLLDISTPASNSATKRVKASAVLVPSSASSGVGSARRTTTFREFLTQKKQRRESGLCSTPGSSARPKSAHVEPETQAWGS